MRRQFHCAVLDIENSTPLSHPHSIHSHLSFHLSTFLQLDQPLNCPALPIVPYHPYAWPVIHVSLCVLLYYFFCGKSGLIRELKHEGTIFSRKLIIIETDYWRKFQYNCGFFISTLFLLSLTLEVLADLSKHDNDCWYRKMKKKQWSQLEIIFFCNICLKIHSMIFYVNFA